MVPVYDHARLQVLWEQMRLRGHIWDSRDFMLERGASLRLVFLLVANVLPGEHMMVLVPPGWSADELGPENERVSVRPAVSLSRRQLEVLESIADGLSLEEIASRLAMSPATARTHAGHALRKLGARNRAHAVALAADAGLIGAASA